MCPSPRPPPHATVSLPAARFPTGSDALLSSPAHSLLGQTYDRDRFEVNGRKDDYSQLDDGTPTASRTGAGGIVTTKAKAEGAIEGRLEDYRLTSAFATTFQFSRFDTIVASARNVSMLGGVSGPRHAHKAKG